MPVEIDPARTTLSHTTAPSQTERKGVVKEAAVVAAPTMLRVCLEIEALIKESITVIIQTITGQLLPLFIGAWIATIPNPLEAERRGALTFTQLQTRAWRKQQLFIHLKITVII